MKPTEEQNYSFNSDDGKIRELGYIFIINGLLLLCFISHVGVYFFNQMFFFCSEFMEMEYDIHAL